MSLKRDDIYDAPYEEWRQNGTAHREEGESVRRKRSLNLSPKQLRWIGYALVALLTVWTIFSLEFDKPLSSYEVVMGRTVNCWEPKGRNSSKTHMLCNVALHGAHTQTVWVPKNIEPGQEIKLKKRSRAYTSNHLYEYMSGFPNIEFDTDAQARRST